MAFFAGYGFNRSHSAAYGWVSYQTAWLKHHYPHEFMAGLMSCDADNTDNVVKFIAEARSMGIEVERPDVNESGADFSVVPRPGVTGDRVIRFGLGAVKGVGAGAVEAVLEARDADGPLLSVYDFCRRVDSQRVNRRVLEALVKSGAFDGVAQGGEVHPGPAAVGARRRHRAGRPGPARQEAAARPRCSACSSRPRAAAPAASHPRSTRTSIRWTPKQLLAFEKESLGFYISGHPLDRYRADLGRYANANTSAFSEGRRGAGEAAIGGVVAAYRERPTKRGDGKLAFFQLEDQSGQLEVIVFPKTFEKVRSVLVSDEPLLCSGKVVDEGEGDQHAWRMLLEDATPLSELRKTKTSRVEIHLDADAVTPEQIGSLRGILESSRGPCRTIVRVRIPRRSETIIPLGETFNVAPTDDLLLRLERLFGQRVTSLG